MILSLALVLTLYVLPAISETRLNTPVIPTYYDVNINVIKLNTEKAPTLLKGTVAITVSCCNDNSDKTFIKLHSKSEYDISISENIKLELIGKVYGSTDIPAEIDKTEESDDILRIKPSQPLIPGRSYRLTLMYDGIISKNNGYIIWHNKKDYLIATNSERQNAFPCFDEPDMRANFKISITGSLGEGKIFINNFGSNSKPKTLKNSISETVNSFPPSQISFVITNVQLKSSKLEFNADWTAHVKYIEKNPPIDVSTLSKDMEPQAKEFMPLPMNNMEFLVIPTHHELKTSKWGLANIREHDFLEESKDKRMYNYYISFTEAIFGGLISPDRWESRGYFSALAEYMALLQMPAGANTLSNILRIRWERPGESLDVIMEKGVDCLQTEIADKQKGLLFLRMINNFFGLDAFLADINRFINEYKYKSVNQNMIWKTFDGKLPDGSDWETVVKKYTTQKSYPIVIVSQDAGGKITLKQEPFVGSYKERMKNGFKRIEEDKCWIVPVPYDVYNLEERKKRDETKWNKWMMCEAKAYSITVEATEDDVLIFNSVCTGIYRVMYDESYWEKVVKVVRSFKTGVSMSTRACIVHDAFSLAWVGYQEYEKVFSLLGFLKNEENSLVWSAFFYAAADLSEILQFSKETYKVYQTFVNSLVSNSFAIKYAKSLFTRLNSQSKKDVTDVDAMFYHWTCITARNEECRKQAIAITNEWMKKDVSNEIFQTAGTIKNLRHLLNTAFCTMLSEKEVYDEEWKKKVEFLTRLMYKNPKHEDYREEFFDVLRCMTHPESIEKFLELASDGEGTLATTRLSMEDKQKMFLALAKGKDSFLTTFNYFKANVIGKILPFHESDDYLARIVSTLTPLLDANQLAEMETLLNSDPKLQKEVIKKAFDEGKAAQATRAHWLERNASKIQTSIKNKFCKSVDCVF